MFPFILFNVVIRKSYIGGSYFVVVVVVLPGSPSLELIKAQLVSHRNFLAMKGHLIFKIWKA